MKSNEKRTSIARGIIFVVGLALGMIIPIAINITVSYQTGKTLMKAEADCFVPYIILMVLAAFGAGISPTLWNKYRGLAYGLIGFAGAFAVHLTLGLAMYTDTSFGLVLAVGLVALLPVLFISLHISGAIKMKMTSQPQPHPGRSYDK